MTVGLPNSSMTRSLTHDTVGSALPGPWRLVLSSLTGFILELQNAASTNSSIVRSFSATTRHSIWRPATVSGDCFLSGDAPFSLGADAGGGAGLPIPNLAVSRP